MICQKPTKAYPDGRAGTNAGWQAHKAAGEGPCEPCRIAANARNRRSYENDKAGFKDRALKNRHSLTRADYDAMLAAQGGGCAICKTTEPGGSAGFYFHVDHDHSCCNGRKSCANCRRGLLCAGCNVGLGALGDDPERLMAAAAYLLEWSNARS